METEHYVTFLYLDKLTMMGKLVKITRGKLS